MLISKHNLLALVLCYSSTALALEFATPISVALPTNQTMPGKLATTLNNWPVQQLKYVKLLNLQLNTATKHRLLNWSASQHIANAPITSSNNTLPSRAIVGMNNVPVLDQGAYGTCTTFANSAAVDALLNKGDYLSQLCHLSLGSYLAKYGYWPSGWQGSTGAITLTQIFAFGIINTKQQQHKICANLANYPSTDIGDLAKQVITLANFRKYSENLNPYCTWLPLLDFNQRLSWQNPSNNAANLLWTVKTALALAAKTHNSVITFGILLPLDYCPIGACGQYHVPADTWLLTKAIAADHNPNLGGHEMIITGYDDNAVAIAQDGSKHQGLFILRNSWGNTAGDHGDYYMSYEFFQYFVFEVQKILLSNN
jgi:hypothetical protein